MKIIGIVGRSYYNRDKQKIIQVNECIRKCFSNYDDVTFLTILPTNDCYYVDTKMGEDKLSYKDKSKLDKILDICDGFVVPGGSSWYNFDEYVIDYAIRNNKSLLCICLGFQALCSMYAKNRIRFDMTDNLGNDSHHGPEDKYIHKNNIVNDTKLRDIIGKDSILVNSVHNSYVNFEMKELVISAFSSDNIIEAVEMPEHKFVIGLEWHPEYLMDSDSIKIFDAFVNSMN